MIEFRLIECDEIHKVIFLIEQRIKWMDQKSLYQWNKTHYLEIFDYHYFLSCVNDNTLYGIFNDSELLVSGVILTNDNRWPNQKEALYIHNLVSKISSGFGKVFIEKVKEMAKKQNKDYLRIDSDVHNQDLLNYYSDLGFKIMGEYQEGEYLGYLQELKI